MKSLNDSKKGLGFTGKANSELVPADTIALGASALRSPGKGKKIDISFVGPKEFSKESEDSDERTQKAAASSLKRQASGGKLVDYDSDDDEDGDEHKITINYAECNY